MLYKEIRLRLFARLHLIPATALGRRPGDGGRVRFREDRSLTEREGIEMIYSRQLLMVLGSGGAMLPLMLPACTQLVGRTEVPPPPVVIPETKEDAPKAGGPKVEQVGQASWYGAAQQGQETASGEIFDQNKLTAAHRTLPLGTNAVVTNLDTGKSVEVKINDRGPYVKGRKIDLSRAAAQKIGMTSKGVTKVKIETRPRRKPGKQATRQTTKHSATPTTTRTVVPTPSPHEPQM